MDNDQYRDGDWLKEEEAAQYVGITVAMLRAARELRWIKREGGIIKPSIKELGLPLKDNPDNVTEYPFDELKRLKDRLANNPDDLATLRSLAKG